jgi:hypothetical protein
MLTRTVGALAFLLPSTALAVLLTAGPAYAHGADAPDATNYRVTITAQPALAGVEVRTIEAGARLQLTNHSGRNVEVLGYQNEPYLEIRPDGVYQNYHSPATYLNITIAHVDPPAHADPTAAPLWQKVSGEPMYRWHDQRALWSEPRPPGDPRQAHHVRDWTVPMRVDASPLTLTGSLDWVPPPSPWAWWLAAIVGALAVAALGFARWASAPMAVLAGVAGGLGLTYAVARERDAGNDTLGPILGQLFTTQLWTTVTSLAALAAAVYALTRWLARGRGARPGEGDFALALGGTAVGLFAGMTNAAVFHRAIAPVPWASGSARGVIAAVIALGGGVAVAAMLRMRGATPARRPAHDPSSEPPASDSPTTSPQPAAPSTERSPRPT